LLHLAKNALALQLPLQRTKRLVNIVVAYQNLQGISDLKKLPRPLRCRTGATSGGTDLGTPCRVPDIGKN
jgi:hypothetical protein